MTHKSCSHHKVNDLLVSQASLNLSLFSYDGMGHEAWNLT